MSTDLPPVEFDEELIFNHWFEHYPVARPPNIAMERHEIAKLTTVITNLERADQSSARDGDLFWARHYRQFSRMRLFRFRDLPDDIILQIFRQGIFSNSDSDAATMPLIYSGICRRWRDLALHSSWLWSLIGFKDQPPYTLTKIFLERSGSAPLIIEIDLSDRRFDWEDAEFWPTAEQMGERLDILLPHINRWRRFSCRTDNWAPIHGALLKLQDVYAPMLKAIEFAKNFDDPAQTAPYPRVQLIRGAPALQVVSLYSVPIDFHNLSSSLTELELFRLSPDELPSVKDFWKILRQSPNLRLLALARAGPLLDNRMFLPPVELLSLEEVVFQGSTTDDPYTLDYGLRVLSMIIPGAALHSLNIGMFPQDSDLLRAVPVLRNFSRITKLVLSDIYFTVANAAQWLLVVPEVEHLVLQGSHTQGTVLEALGDPSQPFGLLSPSLQSVTLTEVDYDTTRDFIDTRIALKRRIRKLVFGVHMRAEAAALNELRDRVDIVFEGKEEVSDDDWIGPDPSEWPMET